MSPRAKVCLFHVLNKTLIQYLYSIKYVYSINYSIACRDQLRKHALVCNRASVYQPYAKVVMRLPILNQIGAIGK